MPTDHVAPSLSDLDLEMVRSIPPGGNWRDVPRSLPSRRLEQIRESAARGEGSRSTYYGRLRWDRPSYTISTYFNRPGNGCTIHPEADRMLTVREAARLQTFPDHVSFHGSSRARHAQVGNAVPPLLAAQVAQSFAPSTAVDLFAGAGGLSIGLGLAGHEVVAAVDHDRHALETLAEIHRGAGVVEPADLSKPRERIRVAELVRHRLDGKPLGLLAGGPPCQGFSSAGWCAPEDTRNDLLMAFIEMAVELRPVSLVLENVAALMWRGRGALELALSRLREAGYHCECGVLHAEAYGVPQRRRRTFLIASTSETPRWPTPWRATADPAYRRLEPVEGPEGSPALTVRDALEDLPRGTAHDAQEDVAYAGAATSALGRWLRGELPLAELVETATAPPQLAV